jgi:hypothetical protein
VTIPAMYRVIVTGRLGPILTNAFADLDAQEIPRHHVLLIPAGDDGGLWSLWKQLDTCGIEVDRVSAWYW